VAVGRGVLVGPPAKAVGVTKTGVGMGVKVAVDCDKSSPLGLILRSHPVITRAANRRRRKKFFFLTVNPVLVFFRKQIILGN
jgi:hypothetical protein